MVATIDCNIPAPHISGISWRPSSCNGLPAVIQVIEAITTFICDNITPVSDTGNNNLRIVPGGTDSGDFNAEFYLSTPADNSIVIEGQNIWWSADAGANWDILLLSQFQVGEAGDFGDPTSPTPAELRDLFPQSLPATSAFVYSTFNKHIYTTDDGGTTWDDNHYVDALGDTMTGTLYINVTASDLPSDDLRALSASAAHAITSDNSFSPVTIASLAFQDCNSFDSVTGPIGITSTAQLNTDAGGSASYFVGMQSSVVHNGGGDGLDGIAFQANPSSNGGGGTVTNFYAFKAEDQTGATNNYAFHSGIGLNRFGDQVSIVGNQNITQFFITGDNAQSDPLIEVDKFGGTALFYLLADGEVNINPAATVGNGGGSTLAITTPGRTAMATTVEQHGIYLDISSDRQWTAGAIANQREIMIERPTYSFTSGSTITNAATMYIKNAPAAGTNATITNAYALWIDDGAVRLDGNLGLGGAQPVARSTGWAVTNPNTRKTFDTTTITLPQLAEVVGTMIAYLISRGDFGA